jgi:hypothetical protein
MGLLWPPVSVAYLYGLSRSGRWQAPADHRPAATAFALFNGMTDNGLKLPW